MKKLICACIGVFLLSSCVFTKKVIKEGKATSRMYLDNNKFKIILIFEDDFIAKGNDLLLHNIVGYKVKISCDYISDDMCDNAEVLKLIKSN